MRSSLGAFLLVVFSIGFPEAIQTQTVPGPDLSGRPLEISGPANPWRFVHAVGERAGVWGFESGVIEGWVYPLKVFHDFSLALQVEGSPIIYPANQLVRAVRVRPDSVDLQYSGERFTVTETLFTPQHEAGFAILLKGESAVTLRIFVRFRPDLSLMWPGAIGGQSVIWNSQKKWLEISEPSATYSALVGSPAAIGSTAVGYHSYLSNEQPYEEIELRLGDKDTQRERVPIIVAAGIRDVYSPEATYERILEHWSELKAESEKQYAELVDNGPVVVTPDSEVNSAMLWSRVSLDQLKVCNPYLGCGYVSGYGSSGTGTRPMYAWFFDEPNVSERAFVEVGNVKGMREAFRFIQKFQREDGQIPHEVSQSAGAIDWFKKYPYAYIHSDTSLWYLIAMEHFFRFTGDRAFLMESWPSIRKAYAYCVSMLNKENGVPQIPPSNWGSMETAGVAVQDSAMTGEWIAALRAVAALAVVMKDAGLSQECRTREKLAADSLEKMFWDPSRGYYNYGVSKSGEKVTYMNPTIGYSAWYGSLPDDHAREVVEHLGTAQFLSDWGVRSMSLEDPRYDENSYQVGSAWPFFTVAPMIADYRYHNAVQGFITWTAMTHLREFNARGAMPESLSGTYYRLLDNGVPHQMFSELVAMPGLVEGVLGLDLDVPHGIVRLTPHLPPVWPYLDVRNFGFGDAKLSVELHQTLGRLTVHLQIAGDPLRELEFSPALPAGAEVSAVTQDGQPVPFRTEDQGSDVHVRISLKSVNNTSVVVSYRGGVGVDVPWQALQEGDTSRNLHVLRTSYKAGHYEMAVEGRPEVKYEIRLWTPWRVESATSAEAFTREGDWTVVRVSAPSDAALHRDRAGYARWTIDARLQTN